MIEAEVPRNATGVSHNVVGAVLAAGEGNRFGSPKQLARFNGLALLEHALATLAAAPLARRLVVLGSETDRILAELDLRGAEPVRCAEWREGQGRSLAAAVRAAGEASALVILLGDQPLIAPEALSRVMEARGSGAAAVRATYGGQPGHPVLLERELFAAARSLRGDAGARALFERRPESVREVPCDGLGSGMDVDTPEALLDLERGAGLGRGP